MRSIQRNTVKNDWPMMTGALNNVYLCPIIIKGMNEDTPFIESEELMLKPYTMEEINAMIDESERESAAGLGQNSEDMFIELADEFASIELG